MEQKWEATHGKVVNVSSVWWSYWTNGKKSPQSVYNDSVTLRRHAGWPAIGDYPNKVKRFGTQHVRWARTLGRSIRSKCMAKWWININIHAINWPQPKLTFSPWLCITISRMLLLLSGFPCICGAELKTTANKSICALCNVIIILGIAPVGATTASDGGDGGVDRSSASYREPAYALAHIETHLGGKNGNGQAGSRSSHAHAAHKQSFISRHRCWLVL